MKQKLFIFLAFIILIVVLVGLNALSYTQKDTVPDSELFANRSTYSSGASGTRAFYELLAETNRNVIRWQENPSALLGAKNKPKTLVIIGRTRLEISDTEATQILQWVSDGGRLVIIDRAPNKNLIATTAYWNIDTAASKDKPSEDTDPSDRQQMTLNTDAARPVQPTTFTRNINAVQPSKFASSVTLEFFGADAVPSKTPILKLTPTPVFHLQSAPPPPVKTATPPIEIEYDEELPPPMAKKTPTPVHFPTISTPDSPENTEDKIETESLNAPFVHLAGNQKNILVDFPFGSGQIIYLTDPYIVSNAGISLVDNAQLAINIVAAQDGLIAFDEYHQGYGANQNRLLEYFAGTPVLAIFAQVILLILFIMWSQSRRFARALPAAETSRLSKLEYVSAFAELQQRTKAYDLALENIYSEFRRKVTRLFGLDNHTTSRKELAQMIAERGKFNEMEVYNLMNQCEEIIRGEPTGKREVLRLTRRLREIEETLRIKRTGRKFVGK